MNFKALRIVENPDKTFSKKIVTMNKSELPVGEVLIKVLYSSLNYKDALSAIGNKGITKKYPHTPGIDVAGIVEESSNNEFQKGDQVICTGFDLGMNTHGGFSEYVRVPASWVIAKPENLPLKECMIYGTSGFTAAQSLWHITRDELNPADGPIIVTGATGAVGSMAVALLATLGFKVTASTRSSSHHNFLQSIGANEIIDANDFSTMTTKGLLSEKFIAGVDTVGGVGLTNILKSTKYRGLVTCCGIVAGTELSTPLFPFILRGIKLIGIDSAECPIKMKKEIWQKLATSWKVPHLQSLAQEISLEQTPEFLDLMLKGQTYGKVVVNLSL